MPYSSAEKAMEDFRAAWGVFQLESAQCDSQYRKKGDFWNERCTNGSGKDALLFRASVSWQRATELLEDFMFVTDGDLNEELKAARALLSGSLRVGAKDEKVSDRYCTKKDAQQAERESEDGFIVGDRKSDEELGL
jgi:hypothetical protein